jgi:2-polyprenyl-3-methyl-5-hydroxy-6-metoxy-1,4-benzoquinol methylase
MMHLPMSITNPAFNMRTKWAVSKSEKVCLEIGCNKGIMTAMLAQNHYVVAGDLKRQILIKAKKNSANHKQNTEFIVFNASNLPFKGKSVDTLLMIDVLEHLENPVDALKQAESVAIMKIIIDLPNYDFATTLYPNMLPEHFNEASHKQRTNVKTLENWLRNITFLKKTIRGSYFPMPLPLVAISYLLEAFFKIGQVKPKRFHFQISCEVLLQTL